MIFKFIKNQLTRGADSEAAASRDRAVEYQDCTIIPTPRKSANGWTTEGDIERDVDGEVRSEHFIRAETHTDQSKRSATPLPRPSASLMSNWLVGANPTRQRGRGFNNRSTMLQQSRHQLDQVAGPNAVVKLKLQDLVPGGGASAG